VTDINQDFNLYLGNDLSQVVAVFSDAANSIALDLSGATEIEWILYDRLGVVKLTKKKSTGGITFVTPPGTNGQIAIAIARTDTASLTAWWYSHRVRVTDGSGNISTVETGRALGVDDSKGG
jgi:hypothetical protein